MGSYLALVAVVFAFNLMPAFAPPTWSVLVLFRLNSHLAPVPLVILGAISAGAGRFLLAKATGLFKSKIPAKALTNLESAGELLTKNKKAAVTTFLLFLASPLPSAQMFEAAGLIGKRILPLTLAFFSGRLISYSLYVAGATQLKDRNLGGMLKNSFTSVWGICIQILSIAAIYGLTQINWSRFHSHEKREKK